MGMYCGLSQRDWWVLEQGCVLESVYKYLSLRPSEEIMAEIKVLEKDILAKIGKVMGNGEI